VAEIRTVDKADQRQLRQWYDAWVASQGHRPAEMVESWEVARNALPVPHPAFDIRLLAAVDGDHVVGAVLTNFPLAENTTLTYAELGVRPERRREGIGTALVAEVERRSLAEGRDRVLFEVLTPGTEPTDDARFAEARGYTLANREETKAVDLAASEGGWAALDAEALAARGDYDVVVWRDVVPDVYAEDYCRMIGQFMSLVPQGDLGLEDAEWTVERLRSSEKRRAETGWTSFAAVAVAPDGTLAGGTDVRASTHDPRIARVGLTMVLPGHRGHRLGVATKLASHRAVREAFPECRLVTTSNSDVNSQMNAINEAMGYRVLETLLEYHRTL
jgi:GNAT superfamily N-acetyltransferase